MLIIGDRKVWNGADGEIPPNLRLHGRDVSYHVGGLRPLALPSRQIGMEWD